MTPKFVKAFRGGGGETQQLTPRRPHHPVCRDTRTETLGEQTI
jgi:hypothetical protein